jgi:glyoxalase family protein
VPPQALGYWSERLRSHGVTPERSEVLGEEVLAFEEPDGLELEIVGMSNAAKRAGWAGGPVPAEHAIRGFAHVTLAEEGYEGHRAAVDRDHGVSARGGIREPFPLHDW